MQFSVKEDDRSKEFKLSVSIFRGFQIHPINPSYSEH